MKIISQTANKIVKVPNIFDLNLYSIIMYYNKINNAKQLCDGGVKWLKYRLKEKIKGENKMHDKKEEKQIKEALNQPSLDDRLFVKICEMKALIHNREKLILILQQELLQNEKNLLEKRGLLGKMVCQYILQNKLSYKGSILSREIKEEAINFKKEVDVLLKSCDELIEKRYRLNLKIQFLTEGNHKLIKYINTICVKLPAEKESIMKNELYGVRSDSPICAENHSKTEADQKSPVLDI